MQEQPKAAAQMDSPDEEVDFSQFAFQSNSPRYLAAMIDQIMVIVLAVPATKYFGNDSLPVQLVIASLVYVAYHFLPEAIVGQTLGKMATGIVVVRKDGTRCTVGQAFLRSFFRLFEVNPIVGAMPAMISILLSKSRQRIGDRVAGTYVVPTYLVE